jgi:sialate O-acetylesterase
LKLEFANTGAGLATTNGKMPSAFYLQGYYLPAKVETIYAPQKITLQGNIISIPVPEKFTVTKIKYAWAPYPDVNLINSEGLPAEPFIIELPGNN